MVANDPLGLNKLAKRLAPALHTIKTNQMKSLKGHGNLGQLVHACWTFTFQNLQLKVFTCHNTIAAQSLFNRFLGQFGVVVLLA